MVKIYATAHLLHGDGAGGLKTFDPGDEIHGHYTPEALEWLIEHEQASAERPDGVTPVYAHVALTHGVHSYARGERIDGALPGPLVRQVIANGEASSEPPEA